MKTIIAGSRTITDISKVYSAAKSCGWEISEVVCGKARGVDTLGEQWAKAQDIPVKYFPADWDRYGKSAGYIRNAQMADYAEALVLVWDGTSRGSKMMRELAIKKGLMFFEVLV